MDFDRVSIALRPRIGWEAVDLGFQMARQWWWPLWGVWLAVYLPVALALVAALPKPVHAVLLLWWLKPLFDRAVLFAASRVVFGEPCGVRKTLANARQWLHPGLISALTLQRFDLARSLMLPVASLEKQRWRAAAERRAVIGRQMRGTAVGLTIVCLHLEAVALLSIFALGDLLQPTGGLPVAADEDAGPILNPWAELFNWSIAEALCYAAAVSIVEPLYVAAGFSLYLNRRTLLEGWDIELRLRRLQQRLGGAAAAVFAAIALCAVLGFAAPREALAQDAGVPLASEEIRRVLADPEFGHKREVNRWRYIGGERRAREPAGRDFRFWRNLSLLFGQISESLLWVAAGILAAAFAYYLLRNLPQRLPAQPPRYRPPDTLFGLNVAPESLPADVAAAAAALLAENRVREALSLLYRAALSALVHRHRVALPAGATEGDSVRAAARALPREGAHYFAGLVRAWQGVAYAGRLPPGEVLDSLVRDWPARFAGADRT